jgi:hypothetical protein
MLFKDKTKETEKEARLREEISKKAGRSVDEEVARILRQQAVQSGIYGWTGAFTEATTAAKKNQAEELTMKDIENAKLVMENEQLKSQLFQSQQRERQLTIQILCLRQDAEIMKAFTKKPILPKNKEKLANIVREALKARKMEAGEIENIITMLAKPNDNGAT